jgi:hypothetical protein
MERTCLFVLLLSACTRTPSPVRVIGTPEPRDALGDGMAFDCDAAPGHYNEWSQPVAPTGHAQGSMFIATAFPSQQQASATIWLLGPERRGRAGLTITLGDRWRKLVPTVRYLEGKSERVQQLHPRAIEGMWFEIEWAERIARIRLERNAPWLEVPLAFVPERFALQCSATESVFHAVSVDAAAATKGPSD